ncbi:MAG: hypothetical protein GX767_01990, partial [Firmicutes bacterium]|nr:hypothetical protein [Bacillota bacterium]
MKLKFRGIGQKITALVILIVLVVCVGIGLIAYKVSSNAIIAEVERALLELAKVGAAKIESDISRDLEVVKAFANLDIMASPEVTLEEKLSMLKKEWKRSNLRDMA